MMPIPARTRTWRSSPSCLRDHAAAVLAFVAVMLVATVEAAQDTTGVGAVSGTVLNGAGQPVEGVRVCVLDTAACAISNAEGVFRMGEIRAGTYSLEIFPLDGDVS